MLKRTIEIFTSPIHNDVEAAAILYIYKYIQILRLFRNFFRFLLASSLRVLIKFVKSFVYFLLTSKVVTFFTNACSQLIAWQNGHRSGRWMLRGAIVRVQNRSSRRGLYIQYIIRYIKIKPMHILISLSENDHVTIKLRKCKQGRIY